MSYVSQQFLPYDSSTTANFQAWGSAISSALSSMGWVKTSDTGQVNWVTVTVPAAGTFVYEVWKPGDALQTGSSQFFLRINYSKSSNNGARIQMQLGTGTDGAGNLTGLMTNLMEPSTGNGISGGAGLTYECNFSGDVNRMSIMLWRNWVTGINDPGNPLIFVIERTHNTDGTDNATGVTLLTCGHSTGTNVGQHTILFSIGSAIATTGKNYVALFDYNNQSGAFNNNIPISPVFPSYGVYGNPMTGIALLHNQDVSDGCEFTTTLYGATRNYMVAGNANPANPGATRVAIRFD